MSAFLGNSSEARAQIDLIIGCFDAGLTPIVTSDPGMGKTALIRAIADEMGYEVYLFIGSRKDPQAMEGLPIVVRDDPKTGKPLERPYTVNSLTAMAEQVARNPKTLIFLDEVRGTNEDVQAGYLTFIQDRELDGSPLPAETLIIMAANPVATGANGQYLAPPLSNRLIHIDFNFPVEDWIAGLVQNFGKESVEAHYVELARMSAYLRSNTGGTGIVETVVPKDPAKADGAFPSRRAWTNLALLLSKIGDRRVVRDLAILGTVGEAAALSFKTWDESLNLPSVAEILTGYEKIEWGTFSTDKIFAVLAMLTNMSTAENIETCAKVFAKIGDTQEALAATMGNDLIVRSKTFGDDMKWKVINLLSAKFRDVLNGAAGITTRAS